MPSGSDVRGRALPPSAIPSDNLHDVRTRDPQRRMPAVWPSGRRRQPSRFNVLGQLNVALLIAHAAFLVGRAAPWKHLAGRLHFGKVAPQPLVRRIPAADLLAKCQAALSDAGLEEGACSLVAASIVAAQRDGKTAHGLGRLNAMATSVASGEVFGHAKPSLAMCAPAVLRVDAHTGFVHPAIALGTEPLVRTLTLTLSLSLSLTFTLTLTLTLTLSLRLSLSLTRLRARASTAWPC
jgi:hypothetical protein